MMFFDDQRGDRDVHVRRLQFLLDRLPALIGYWDLDQRNVLANAAYLEYFGLDPQQMRGMHLRDVLGEEVYESNLPYVTRVLQGEEQLFDRTLVAPSGRVRQTQASYVPDVVDGAVRGFFVLVTDVSERIEAQQAMEEAQHLAHVGSWSMVVSTGRVRWSSELCRIFGVDPAFVPTLDELLVRIDPGDVDRVRTTIGESLVTGEDYEQTYRILREDGERREMHCLGRALRATDGTVVRLTGTLQDVTERRRAARELAQVNAELRQVNGLNADVLAMLGHDVRSPLTVILGYLEELTSDQGDTADPPGHQRDQLGRVFHAAQRLQGLIDNILAMATVDHGQITTNPLRVRLLDEVREALSVIPGSAAVTVVAHGDLHAWADGFHVRQVVANLVTNALRYGAPPVSVTIAAEGDTPGTVSVTVSDHGPGVPEDDVASLFERFSAGPAQGPRRPGVASSGFGLYVAAGLAVANHGRVEYSGSPAGASFTLTLPATRAGAETSN